MGACFMKRFKQAQQNKYEEIVSHYSLQQQQVWIAAGVAVAGAVAGGVQSSDASRKALHASQDAAKAGQVNIADVTAQAQKTALNNATLSQQLEQQLTPGVSTLKTNSINDVLANMGPNQYNTQAGNLLMHASNNPAATITAGAPTGLAAANAAATNNLANGNALPYAQLPTELSNLATRNALAHAGTTNPGSLGLGRDLTARDLGLTSLQLGQTQEQTLNNRIAAASGAGQAQGQFNLSQAGQGIQQSQFGQNQALQQAAALQALSSGDFAKYLAAAQFGQSIKAPVVGLDPGSVANLMVGNTNNAAGAIQQQGQIEAQAGNNQAAFYGQLAGIGSGAIAKYNATPKAPAYNAPIGSTTSNPNFNFSPTSGYFSPGGAGAPTG
jgi:hypothetical protein